MLKQAILLLILITPTFGQVNSDSLARTYGLRFLFESLSTSRGGLGGKIWMSDKSALAPSVILDSRSVQDGTYSSSSLSIDLALDYEHHFVFSRDFSLFGLARPLIGYRKSRSGFNSVYSNRTSWQMGLGVGIGVEYWLATNLSLSASQALSYRYEYSTSNNENNETLYLRSTQLTAAIYF